ncbi:TrapT dctQ-M fusion permease, dicarboxylate transport [Caballeronia pedi]|uniref:TrapT dctQ-M fusion permease, dicarboxylate transport n=1 Tax=Caballeronia pedi TaxID=1777141 RepID=A0A157ZTK1_9BURK|nr:TRAP transporter large permease subunit [Caballeronia pedi]SAK48247.1 TrapT dctQ-M fusion permease, dicarboxylate transport [Caballeronia pedi]
MSKSISMSTETVHSPMLHTGERLLVQVEQLLGSWAGAIASVILIMESVILGVGVFSRYVLHRPIFWTDEFALILFAWLSMLGAAVALRRGAHMRLGFIVEKLRPATQARVSTFAWTLLLGLMVALLYAAVNFTVHSWTELTPALQWHLSVRTASMVVGFALMAVTAATKLTRIATLRSFFVSFALLIAIGAALYYLQGSLQDIGNYNLIFFFVVLVLGCIGMGVEIAFAFALAAMAYLSLMTNAPTSIIMNRLDAAISDITLLSIPMFILVGVLLDVTGLAKAIINLMVALLGHTRGGLHYVLLGGMYLVSGISGSKSADMAAIAPIILPEMKRRGEKEGELVALLSVSGAMAETIPPSIILIAVGVASGVSISSLFVGGFVPAIVGLLALAAVVFVRTRGRTAPDCRKATGAEIRKAMFIALPAIPLPFLIRAAVVEGVATATEVATIGVLYSVICGIFVYRQFPLKRVCDSLIATVSLTGAILLVTGLAGSVAWSLTQSGFSDDLSTMMQGLPGGATVFLLVSIAFFAILGSVLEGFPAIVLFSPLMFPIATSYSIHGVHYAIVVVLSLSIGLFAPPFGVGFYSACAIGGVEPQKAMKDIFLYMAVFVCAVVLIAFVPWFSIGFLH